MGIFECGHYQELKKIPMELWIQEGIMGQTGSRPVLPLGYVYFIKVNFRTIKCMKLIGNLWIGTADLLTKLAAPFI